MASLRQHAWLDIEPDVAWALVGAPERAAEWFPGVEAAELAGVIRTCRLRGGLVLREEIVTRDPGLRRLQYRILDGLTADSHLATIDVLPDRQHGSLVVYSTDITPDALSAGIARSVSRALDNLAARRS